MNVLHNIKEGKHLNIYLNSGIIIFI